jgi:hypothetical protein
VGDKRLRTPLELKKKRLVATIKGKGQKVEDDEHRHSCSEAADWVLQLCNGELWRDRV